jgi:hypothetical protein
MSNTVIRQCRRCQKESESTWKNFARWLRNNRGKQPDDYLCPTCSKIVARWKHGDSKTILYGRWKDLFRRTNPDTKNLSHARYYVAKGITVCAEWHDYKNFQQWALANGFQPDLYLDRIDGNGSYSPENCRWTTALMNTLNRTSDASKKLSDAQIEEIRSLASAKSQYELAELFGVSQGHISAILNYKKRKKD